MLRTLVNWLDTIFRWVLALLIVMMVAAVCWQIVSRYFLNDPSQWTEELARFLLIWIGMLGAAYAYHLKMHLGLDIVQQKLSSAGRRYHRRYVHCVVILFAVVVMIAGGIKFVMLTYDLKQVSAALGWPMHLVYLCLPVSGVMLVVYALLDWLNDDTAAKEGTQDG